MLRPYLKHISKESRRCAELLAQLPPDMDVEGMVAATWSVVKKVGAVSTPASVESPEPHADHCTVNSPHQHRHSVEPVGGRQRLSRSTSAADIVQTLVARGLLLLPYIYIPCDNRMPEAACSDQ